MAVKKTKAAAKTAAAANIEAKKDETKKETATATKAKTVAAGTKAAGAGESAAAKKPGAGAEKAGRKTGTKAAGTKGRKNGTETSAKAAAAAETAGTLTADTAAAAKGTTAAKAAVKKPAAKKPAAKTAAKKTAAKTAKPPVSPEQQAGDRKILMQEALDGAIVQKDIDVEKAKPEESKNLAKPAADKAQEEAADARLMVEALDGAKVQEEINVQAETEKPAVAPEAAKPAADAAQVKAAAATLMKEAVDGAKVQEEISVQAETEKPAKAADNAKAAATEAQANAANKTLMKEALDGAEIQREIEEEKAKPASAKKAAAKKPAAKTAAPKKKPAAKAEPAKEEKKPEISDEEKKASYQAFDVYTLVDMAKAMGIDMNLDDYQALLMKEADEQKILADILAKYPEAEKDQDFEANGYDLTLLPVVLEKAAEGMDVKAADFATIAQEIEAALQLQLTDDGMHNADVYNTLFDLVRRLLVMGQNKGIDSFAVLNETIPADLMALLNKFMDVAYAVLPTWQYKDVKYYEGFIYAVLSQFEDLHQGYDNRAMMDVADLFIRHGDYGLGDANYNYILRENQLKDQIYFRFADVYRNIDMNKAKAIANSAMQFVDGRYDYYPRIIEILES